ncbi:MAG: PrgI family protein [Candidatus Saccharimonadales bacterium]
MAVYKVPQDVEADDKLIGPFSFRQFIYLIIVAISIALAWGLSQLFIPLAIIPLPIILFFGALALPLRKDQPMEIYLAAIVSFYLKPRRRLWEPDGIQSLVEITAPKVIEVQRTKNISQNEAEKRLSYLASVVDSGGWAVRGVPMPTEPDNSMVTDMFFEAQQAEDVLDNNAKVSQSFDTMIGQADVKRRQDMINQMHQQPIAQPAPVQIAVPDPYAALTQTPTNIQDPHLTFNPYPNSMQQTVIRPLSDNQPIQSQPRQAPVEPVPVPQPQQQLAPEPIIQPVIQAPETTETNTSENRVSPDIISLASNSDLSIETIAHEANRIRQKQEHLDEEVLISLR